MIKCGCTKLLEPFSCTSCEAQRQCRKYQGRYYYGLSAHIRYLEHKKVNNTEVYGETESFSHQSNVQHPPFRGWSAVSRFLSCWTLLISLTSS